MDGRDVLDIVDLFRRHGIEIHIDGGWGVDALLGRQTRIHSDLDIALEHRDVPLARQLLEARGYTDVPRDDTRDCNFVLGDATGHEVDFHSYTFDDAGELVFGVAYPLESLTGTGVIDGCEVRCISPEWMVKFHTGYAVDDDDYHDVKALCDQFELPLPPDYAAWRANDS